MNDCPPTRLASIDALRGFDMFWITGGADLVGALVALLALGHLIPLAWSRGFAAQMQHVEWAGLNFIDLVFPVFVFIAGLSYPFSRAKRVAAGESPLRTHLAILRRVLTLLALGLVYNGFLKSDLRTFADFRYFSVLGKIGIAWGVAALVYVHCGFKARLAVGFAGLAAYWTMLSCVAPDAPAGAGPHSLEGCFVGWLDRRFTFGHLYCDNLLEPSGPFVSFFGFPTALLGMFAGDIVRSARFAPARKSLLLAVCGAACLTVGYALSPLMPIVKKLWTPTFALVASGYGFLAFALFHYLIDVRGWTRWCFPFKLIGVNAIAIYFSQQFVDYVGISDFFFAGVAALAGPFALFLRCLGAVGVRLAFLGFLYRHKIFFRV